jgi:nucleotide-binding universal stress UspA family protein
MKTILAPIDFSEAAANSAEFAGNLAAFYGAELWLYHAYELPVSISEYAFPVISSEEIQAAAEHELQEFKKDIQDKLRYPITINIKSEMSLLRDGLDAFCDKIRPDIVVMGLSGKTGLSKLLVGSNTIKAIHYLKYPVLVIPPKATFIPIRKIGFACDFEKVLQTTPIVILEKVIRDFNAELHVMNVHPHNRNYKPEAVQESMYIGELLHKFKPEYHTIESEDVTEGVNWFAEKAKLDWIVAIPKKHNLVDKIFKRSHTEDLLYHTHVPVLCMHE